MITRADTIDTFNKAVSKVERTEFQSIPPDRPPPAEVVLNQELEQALSLEVENLVKKVAIAQTTASDGSSARSLLFPRKRRLAPRDKSHGLEPFCVQPPLQNGKHHITQRHRPEKGLHGSPRLEGRIPDSLSDKQTLEVLEIQMEAPGLRVSNHTLWAGLSPESIHQVTKTGSSNTTEKRGASTSTTYSSWLRRRQPSRRT